MSKVIDARQEFEEARENALVARNLKEIREEMKQEFVMMSLIEFEIMKAEEEEEAIRIGYEEGLWDV